jgi:predicted phosphatase
MKDVMDANDEKCHFYLEQTIENSWQERDHVLWVNEARAFVESISAESPDEALDILRKVMSVVRAAEIILEQYPAARKMLVKLIS